MDTTRDLAALDELPEAVIVLLPVRDASQAVLDFEFHYANRGASIIAGRAAGALVGHRLREALPAFPPAVFDELVGVLDGGEPLRTLLDYSDRFAGGPPFSARFEISASRLGDGLLVVYEDAGARARAQATERRYGAVLEATSDWVSIADRDNNLVYVNSGGRRMVGIGIDEDISGRRIGEFSPRWARERVLGEALEVARREGSWRGDLARLHRDGHEIPVSQVIVARTAADGEVDFYATIARDMTRERAAEAALRESEERFRIAFEQAPIGVSLLDLEGNFVQVNDAYCAIVRRPREELMRAGPIAVTHPDDVAFTRYAMRLLISGKVPVLRFEKRFVDAAGESIWVELSGSLFRDAEGRPQYLIGMLQDLSERRVAHTLQRSMLTRLPQVDGVELAARYLPGTRQTEVSGDWYDVIPLPDWRVGVVIGDVVGRGIEAAATMSQLRTALRAYAVEGLEPAVVVGKLHRLVEHLRVGMSTTLVYLDLDPFTRAVRYVSAGHLPLLHVAQGGEARYLGGARSTPLGTAAAGGEIPQEHFVLEPGDTVLLYTDGLVERRDDSIDRRLEQLRVTFAEGPQDLQAALEHLTTTLGGDDEALRQDDVALLALRMSVAAQTTFAATIEPAAEQLGGLRGELRAWLAHAGATSSEAGDVLIAVGEACANAIEHAGAAAGAAIDVRGQLVNRDVVVRVRDRGAWRPSAPQPERGHGLRLMRVLMDHIDISRGDDGTRIELRKRLSSRAAHADGTDEGGPVHNAATLAFSRERGVTVVRLQGEIDLAGIGSLGRALAAEVRDADRGLVLDLDGVEYLDSAGLHLLHDASRMLEARGQSMRVAVAPGATVERLLELVDIERTVALEASVEAAVEALVPPPLI